jgi:exodeoxyribonuclease-3
LVGSALAVEVEVDDHRCVVGRTGALARVAILSRVGLADVEVAFAEQPGYANEEEDALLAVPVVESRAVGATCGGLRIWSLYVPNGRTVDHPHYAYKLQWLQALRTALAPEVGAGPFVVTGDFNIAPTDADVWDPKAFVGSTHVTPAERAELAALRDLGLRDVVPRAMKYDTPYTYWDYRAGMFHKNMGMRIDLVYANDAVTVTDASVDRDARKGTGPSLTSQFLVHQDLAVVVHRHPVEAAVVELLVGAPAPAGERDLLGDQTLLVLVHDLLPVMRLAARREGRFEASDRRGHELPPRGKR